jgi:hypothetical protein
MAGGPWTEEHRENFKAAMAARSASGLNKTSKAQAGGYREKPVKVKDSCSICNAFRLSRKSELTGLVNGTCHAHPPTMHINFCNWPTVDGSDWCREFKNKNKVEK